MPRTRSRSSRSSRDERSRDRGPCRRAPARDPHHLIPCQAESDLAEHYRRWHAELTHRLAKRFAVLEPTELFVACTANARSELLISSDGTSTIVHDQNLGRTLNRLTQYVIGDWPASRVHAWAFERVAVASLATGSRDDCQLALALAASLRERDAVPQIDPERDAVRQLIVGIAEFFVLAHEVAHTALGKETHQALADNLRDDLEDGFLRRTEVRAEHQEAVEQQMRDDAVQAIGRHLGRTDPTPEQLDRLRALTPSAEEEFDESAWLREHVYLYEEIA